MPTKRPAACYRKAPKKPYTRKEYIRAIPQPKLKMPNIGNYNGQYDYAVLLISEQKGVILDRALEAARVAANRYLTKNVGRQKYFMRIRTYPHHIIRETKFLGIAGADRIQQGMRRAFGKPVDRGAIVGLNQIIMEIWVKKSDLQHAKEAIRRASHKIGLDTRIEIKKFEELYPKAG